MLCYIDYCMQIFITDASGCYPTAAQLPLVPLLRAGLISDQDIIIDAKVILYVTRIHYQRVH